LLPLVVLPLDVTHKALNSTARIDAFRAMGTRAATRSFSSPDFRNNNYGFRVARTAP
jgi:purine nucleosidase